jgi:hypothetical protein
LYRSGGIKGFSRNKLPKYTNHRGAENTERGEIEKIFASVLDIFLFGSPKAAEFVNKL